jgi:CheY-like chemotaxis protein
MGARVLVVNDTQEILDIFRLMLEEDGYEGVLYSFAPLDLAEVKRVHPDLVVLDLIFGAEKLGWQLLDKMRMTRSTAKIPVIVCTAAVIEVRQIDHSPQLKPGIPGPNTAAGTSPGGVTRSLVACVSPPLHRRRFPQALRYADSRTQQGRRFLPMAKARGLRAGNVDEGHLKAMGVTVVLKPFDIDFFLQAVKEALAAPPLPTVPPDDSPKDDSPKDDSPKDDAPNYEE